MLTFSTALPLSLYIHIPWCVRKCPYCDFNSHEAKQGFPEDTYVDALLLDLHENLPFIHDRKLCSIFFGGGTPSLFSAQAIARLLQSIDRVLPLEQETEITLEANPGTIDEGKFADFRQAGVNRLSIGVQSLQDSKLKALGRIHNREYALRAIEQANNAGFDNFNLDLMHGLPGQSLADALTDIQEALRFSPPHLSWYQLTIEPNTFFYQKPPVLPTESVLGDIGERGTELITQSRLAQYEVSAYAEARRECKHNVNYWEFGDYLGIGAGAHSKITDREKGIITRQVQVRNPRDYLHPKKAFVSSRKILTPEEIVFEFMLNALRLVHGVPVQLFCERTGLTRSVIDDKLLVMRDKKLLVQNEEILCTTQLGQRFLNDVVAFFL